MCTQVPTRRVGCLCVPPCTRVFCWTHRCVFIYMCVCAWCVCACCSRCVPCCERACVVTSHGTCDAHSVLASLGAGRTPELCGRRLPPHLQALSLPSRLIPLPALTPFPQPVSLAALSPSLITHIGEGPPLLPSSRLMPSLKPLAEVEGCG